MTEFLQAITTLLSLINPMVCVMMFGHATAGAKPSARFVAASQAMLTVGVILAMAALLGARLLALFGVSLDAFAVAGGGVLVWIGIGMFRPAPQKESATPQEDSSAQPQQRPALGKLIMFAASPGTITGVITLAAAHSGAALPLTALAAIGVAVVVTGVLLVALPAPKDASGGTPLVREITTSYMGLIVIAMGVQFALTGLKAFFAS